VRVAFADLHLYDEERKHLVGFRDATRLLRQRKAATALKPETNQP
jgi:hypothetical protein